jgi:YfiH family protein
MKHWIYPNWPAPPSIGACMTTRSGGYSAGPYGAAVGLGGLNLGEHTGDVHQVVAQNRQVIQQYVPQEPVWLEQVHSDHVLELPLAETPVTIQKPVADGVVTKHPEIVCAILTADCLPVLFCDHLGRVVGAAHAGWRGLCAGIIEKTALAHRRLADCSAPQQMAWLGPAIGPTQFEVGQEVRDAFFAAALPDEKQLTLDAFTSVSAEQYLCDLYQLAQIRLRRVHITQIYQSPLCTFSHPQHFYSYRRERITGRMATMIWLR